MVIQDSTLMLSVMAKDNVQAFSLRKERDCDAVKAEHAAYVGSEKI